jgi:hypothetical protein
MVRVIVEKSLLGFRKCKPINHKKRLVAPPSVAHPTQRQLCLDRQGPSRGGANSFLLSSVVRAVGIEPTLLSEPDFESGASTNSTTPAMRFSYNVAIKLRNVKSASLPQSASETPRGLGPKRFSIGSPGRHRRITSAMKPTATPPSARSSAVSSPRPAIHAR